VCLAVGLPAAAQHWGPFTEGPALGGSKQAAADEELFRAYREFNRQYFAAKLPEANVVVQWDAAVELGGNVALTWITNYEGEGEKIAISISTRMQGCEPCASMTLLHEMVHVKLRKRDGDQHGKAFQREMRRLVRLKAFDRRW